MNWRRLFTSLGVMLLLAGCGGGGPTGNNGNQNGTANFSAKIDGVQWTSLALSTTASGSANGVFTLAGGNVLTGGTTGLSITMYNIGAPGTYPLGVGGTVAGGTVSVTQGANAWSTPLSGAAGTMTITSVSGTRVAGTFSGNVEPSYASTTGTKALTAGTFDLTVKSTGSVAVADNMGSKVTGTLGGTAWNAATVVMVASPSSGTLTFGASNTDWNINMIVSSYAGAGTYPMNPGGGVTRSFTATSLTGGTKQWGGSGALAAGSVTVTSASATRIKGSFNVTLQPGASATGTLTFAGTFDLGVP